MAGNITPFLGVIRGIDFQIGFYFCQRIVWLVWFKKFGSFFFIHQCPMRGRIIANIGIGIIHIRLFVFIAQGIDVIDPFAGKFAFFVEIVFDMGVNVVCHRIEAIVRLAKIRRAELFE